MKFNAKQVRNGDHAGSWAVFKGNSKFWPHTAGTKEQAEQAAILQSAEWHLEQAKTLIEKVNGTPDFSRVHSVGAIACGIVDSVIDWNRKNWLDHDEMDARNWTC